MEILNGILKEELNKLKSLKNNYEHELNKLLKGSLVKKEIKGQVYYYLNYRDGKKVFLNIQANWIKKNFLRLKMKSMKEENLENYLSKLKKTLQNQKKYLMEGKSNLFLATLKLLCNVCILEDIILIGSWCHYFQFPSLADIQENLPMKKNALLPEQWCLQDDVRTLYQENPDAD